MLKRRSVAQHARRRTVKFEEFLKCGRQDESWSRYDANFGIGARGADERARTSSPRMVATWPVISDVVSMRSLASPKVARLLAIVSSGVSRGTSVPIASRSPSSVRTAGWHGSPRDRGGVRATPAPPAGPSDAPARSAAVPKFSASSTCDNPSCSRNRSNTTHCARGATLFGTLINVVAQDARSFDKLRDQLRFMIL